MYWQGAFLPDGRKYSLHLGFLAFHIRVDVTFQCDVGVSMTQNFAEGFDVAAALQAGSGEGMPQGMGMHPAYSRPVQITLDALSVAAGFHRPFGAA